MNPKEEKVSKLIKEAIRKKNPKAEVVLFGSRARGDFNQDSDWDILILLNRNTVDKKIEIEYRNELFEIELEIGSPISTFVYSRNEWETKHRITPLYQNIKAEGIYL